MNHCDDDFDVHADRIDRFEEVVGRCDEVLELLDELRELTYGGDVLEARETIRRVRDEADRAVTLWVGRRRPA